LLFLNLEEPRSVRSGREPLPDFAGCRFPPAQPSRPAFGLRLQPAFVAIHWTCNRRLSCSRFVRFCLTTGSGLRLHQTAWPRLRPCRRLAPSMEPRTLLSCPSLGLRLVIGPSGLIFARVVSLHRRLMLRFCCPARCSTCVSRRAFRPCLRSPRACAFGSISGSASPVALQLAPSLDRSASPSALFVSLRRELCFRICLPASPVGLRLPGQPFSLSFGSVDRLAPSTELPVLPSCLAALLALCDRPFSLTFLPDRRFPDCLCPLALPSSSSSALASDSAAGPSVRFDLRPADCRLSGFTG